MHSCSVYCYIQLSRYMSNNHLARCWTLSVGSGWKIPDLPPSGWVSQYKRSEKRVCIQGVSWMAGNGSSNLSNWYISIWLQRLPTLWISQMWYSISHLIWEKFQLPKTALAIKPLRSVLVDAAPATVQNSILVLPCSGRTYCWDVLSDPKILKSRARWQNWSHMLENSRHQVLATYQKGFKQWRSLLNSDQSSLGLVASPVSDKSEGLRHSEH